MYKRVGEPAHDLCTTLSSEGDKLMELMELMEPIMKMSQSYSHRFKCGRFLNVRRMVGQAYCPTVTFQLCHGVTIALLSEWGRGCIPTGIVVMLGSLTAPD